MAYNYDSELYSSTTREESYVYGGVYRNCKAPPVASELRTIIEDCRGVVYYAGSNHMPQQDHGYNGWTKPQTTATAAACSRAPVRPSFHVVMKEPRAPVMTAVNYNPKPAPLTSDEAARIYGGVVYTRYGRK